MLDRPASAVPEQLALPSGADEGGLVHWHGFRLALAEGTLPPWYSTEACLRTLDLAAGDMGRIGSAVDLGCGSGIIALALAKTFKVPRVVASEVSRSDAALASRNVELNCPDGRRPGIEVRHSDVFDAFPAGERFDLVVANLPIDPRPPSPSLRRDFGPYVTSLRDVGYAAHRKLFAQISRRLTDGGRLLLCASRTLSDGDALGRIIAEAGMRIDAQHAFLFHAPTARHPDKSTVYNCLWIRPGGTHGSGDSAE